MFVAQRPALSYAWRGHYNREDSLSSFTWLGYLDADMTPQQVAERATAAFFLWPKTLLDEELNRSLLASTVQHDLFSGSTRGWERYVKERRKDVAWFAEGLQVPPHEAKPESRFSRWPWPEETWSSWRVSRSSCGRRVRRRRGVALS